MIAGLVHGFTTGEVADIVGVKPTRVSNLKREIAGAGLDAVLEKMESAIASANAAAAKPRGKSGPVGINTVDEWLATVDTDSESVLEIAELVVGPGAHVAVLVVRDRKRELSEKMVGAGTYASTVRKILTRPIQMDLHWTKLSYFDDCLATFVRKSATKLSALEKFSEMYRWPEDFPSPCTILRDRFGPDYEFLIVAHGDAAERNVRKWCETGKAAGIKINPADVVFTESSPEFFNRLAGTIYRLRERWSCAGLLPLHWRLRDEIEKWAERDDHMPFYYEFDGECFRRILKHAVLLWRYPAIFGALFHMDRSMWSRLPWRSEFSLGVASLRPRVEVEPNPEKPSGVLISIRILPGLGYEFHATPEEPVALNEKMMEQGLRRFLRDGGAAPRFFYSTRRQSFEEWLEVIRPDRSGEPPAGFDRIRAVLVPRHFIVTNEALPHSELAATAEDLDEGVLKREVAIGGITEPSLIFHAPGILAAIRRAYEANTYGDELHSLRIHLQGIVDHLGSMEQQEPLMLMSLARLNPYRLSYWCLDPQTKDKEGADKWRWDTLKLLQENAQRDSIPFDFRRSDDRTVEEGFRDLLRDCDADFLLRGLSPADRTHLEELTETWAQQVKSLIGTLYDGSNTEGRGRVIAAVDPELRAQAAARMREVVGWVHAALNEFAESSRRVDRKAVEAAQRCSLAGLQPIALVVESEGSIIRRWIGFFRRRVKSEIMPHDKRPKKGKAPPSKFAKLEEDEFNFENLPDPHTEQSGEVEEVIELVRKFVERPRDRYLAEDFAIVATNTAISFWPGVLKEFAEQPDGAAIKAAVEDGLKICKARGGASRDSRLEALMGRFEELGRPVKSTVKKRSRATPGE